MRAEYAVQNQDARGRLVPETESASRSPWQRDRDRILHSSGFRMLQYKTQVFINHEGDFFRTRLTHSLEVAQIARSIARNLGVNEDLTEALALAHDLGHTPFGHAGEEALASAMQAWGGFDHNTQSLRQVIKLEKRYHAFDGLNLTWETLEGLAKHNGPVTRPTPFMAEYEATHHLGLAHYASAEAQIAALSDDIAYHGHDLDDGLRAGLLTFEDIAELPIVGEALRRSRAAERMTGRGAPDQAQRARHEMVRLIIDTLVTDLTEQTRRNLSALAPRCADDIRHAPRAVVAFSPDVWEKNKIIRAFLFSRLYRHWRVNRMARKAKMTVTEIFRILSHEPGLLPDAWRSLAESRAEVDDEARRCRVVADYIAGMTDRFAMEEHRRLTDLSVLG